jgi:DNA polymerase-1
VLTRLAAVHPVPKLILEYRTLTKLKNTYVDTLPQFINPKTGRLHTSFRQTVAATGRLSSDKPNLQNIPMRTEMGRRIRKAFRAQEPGCVLVSADYSQVELRLLAHLSGDPGLIEAFRSGTDVHTVTAAKIFGVPEAKVDGLLRSRAKAVNFGIIYGMGPQRLAQETGVTLTEAKDFIARYFDVYPKIREYTESLIETARQTGSCVTIMGRRRPIPEISEKNQAVLARGENIAVNAPIQGSAADLIKLAMIRVHAELQRRARKARLVLQVHDELVVTAPEAEATAVMELVRDAMEQAMPTTVPLKVEVHAGKTWLDAHG